MRATVIDHDADIVELVCELLEVQGIDCTRLSSAMPGIDELNASKPDLIIVDLGLRHVREGLTGLQVVHAARSGTPLRDVPIIVLTADPPRLAEAWPDVMERGDIHRLTKPFDLTEFERVVNTALGRAQAGTESAGSDELRAVPDGTSTPGTTSHANAEA
jgi:DNA-binding response OmpR family regulator